MRENKLETPNISHNPPEQSQSHIQGVEPHTPSSPIPLPSSRTSTTHCNSCCRLNRRARCSGVVTGRASTHFCKTAHIEGPPRRGWITVISSSCDWAISETDASPSLVGAAPLLGSTACHCARRRATPRQMGGETRSRWPQGLPRMKRYSRPFLKRARRGGARPRLASRAWDLVSPNEQILLQQMSQWAVDMRRKGLF